MRQDILTIQHLTALHENEQNAMPRYYSQLPQDGKNAVWDLVPQLSANYYKSDPPIPRSIREQAAFLRACHVYREQQKHQINTLEKEHNEDRIRELRVQRIVQNRKNKSSPNALWIERHYPELHKLRHEHGLSWREISNYIRIHHRKIISHTYLAKVIITLESK